MIFRCGRKSLDLSFPNVMAILNVTPDSFSDGGRFSGIDQVLFAAEQYVADGASILDIGGESTRPGAEVVEVSEELERVVPVIEAIAARLDVVLSVDTSTPEVMLQACAAGASMINDVRALEREGALSAAARLDAAVCLMHMSGSPATMQDAPEYGSVVADVRRYLQQRVSECEKAGVNKERLLLDPGFGFGKTVEHNFELLSSLSAFHEEGFPLLIGLSRKSMLGAVTGIAKPEERGAASVAGAVIAAMRGAHIVRVHDVRETVEAMKIVTATFGGANV